MREAVALSTSAGPRTVLHVAITGFQRLLLGQWELWERGGMRTVLRWPAVPAWMLLVRGSIFDNVH